MMYLGPKIIFLPTGIINLLLTFIANRLTSQTEVIEVLNLDNTFHHFIPQNTNELLREIPEIIGGKTGWGVEAGGCLLLVLDNPEEEGYFVSIVLGAKVRFAEMRKLINAIR